MEIDRGAQLAQRKCRTLDMPARAAGTPQRVPGRLVFSGGVPQHKVKRRALVRIVDIAAAFLGQQQHLLLGVTAEGTKGLDLGDIEVHRPARLVREPAVQHHADESPDVSNRRRSPRRSSHRQRVQCFQISFETSLLAGCQIEVMDTQLPRLLEQRIVNISYVADTPHSVPHVDQPALQYVVRNEGRGMAQVSGVIGRDPTGVHEHLIVGFERDNGAFRGVVELHRQSSTTRGSLLIPVNRGATRVL